MKVEHYIKYATIRKRHLVLWSYNEKRIYGDHVTTGTISGREPKVSQGNDAVWPKTVSWRNISRIDPEHKGPWTDMEFYGS